MVIETENSECDKVLNSFIRTTLNFWNHPSPVYVHPTVAYVEPDSMCSLFINSGMFPIGIRVYSL